MSNPYYDSESLGLEARSLDELDLCYQYNTLLFVRLKGTQNVVYCAQDSGCSCPTPFEDFAGETQEAVLQKMTRVRDLVDARRIYDEWSGNRPGYDRFEAAGLKEWFA